MEESKELQGFYKIFRAVIYISVLMEFFEYAIDPAMLCGCTIIRWKRGSTRCH